MPQDRAQRPDPSQGSPLSGYGSDDASMSGGGAESSEDGFGGSGGTYFLGRYRIVDEIGIGGMASVHLARMDGPGGFQKWVAIKKIHSHLVEDESFVQMFLDEARVAARISHPNVATVFDLGKHEDTYWIAMEYLHGEPLREVMRRTEELGTAMPPEIACRVIADAAEGLHAAHELLGKDGEKLGLVHRDVTPHNLFVTYDGVTKVVDFGIAKFSSRMSHTRAGTLKGKLAYMSPEQVHGEGIDRRTDIFALGVVLWELTTGQRLFRMESDLDTLAKVQECNVPRPSTLIRGYPVDLEKIVMKALAKNRAERFKTARELSRALQSLLMRRGLFIASDEVAAYTQSIFNDRIQKREAHLRWAAEVTQTINVDGMLSKPKIGPEYTGSELAPSASGVSAPPARQAPAPAPVPAPTARATPKQLLPDDLNDPGISLTAPRRGTEPPRPVGRAAAPPRPAAGAPPPPPPDSEEPHPSDGDGPTIQALPYMVDEGFAAARAASLSEPPNLANDPPTLMGALKTGKNGVEVLEPEEFEEDGDETLVANTAKGAYEPRNGSAFTKPPAAHGPTAAIPVPVPQQPSQAPSPQQAPTFRVPNTMPPAPGPYAPAFTGEVPFTDPSATGPQMGIPSGYEMGSMMGADAFARPQFGPHDLAPRGDHPSGRIYPSLGADNRTMQVQRVVRRPPMWVVAALSCSIALLIAGIVIAVLSTTSAPRTQQPAMTPNATAAAMNGPFTTARTAFNSVVAAPPPSAVVAPTVAAAPSPPPPAETAEPAPTTTASAAPTTPTATATPAPRPPPVPQPAPAPAPVAKKSSAPGALTVVCLPKCDQIIDNGASLGPGHIFNKPVPSGRHALILSAPNGVRKTLQVEVLPDQTRDVRISMERP